MIRVAVIGAGAAGCFFAVEYRRLHPESPVTVFESGSTPLAKLAVTGGGRCNITNTFALVDKLSDVYPRGEKLVRQSFRSLSPEMTTEWWEKEGVKLTVQPDQCIFPKSQDAMQVVNKLLALMDRYGVQILLSTRVERVSALQGGGFLLETPSGNREFDKVVVTSGGGAIKMLEGLDLEIIQPRPSLFTFRLKEDPIKELMGTVVQQACLSLAGTRFKSHGTLLITDWGVSGPATLKLSSYAAIHLADSQYKGTLLINYLDSDEASVREMLGHLLENNPQKLLSSVHPDALTSRLWKYLLVRSGLREDMRCAELGSKGFNRLVNTLTADGYEITGRCAFKDEFVTAGGVAATNVNPHTLESRKYPGLFFAGEVLDIDAVTGGFNLQAAWSTAYLVSRNV